MKNSRPLDGADAGPGGVSGAERWCLAPVGVPERQRAGRCAVDGSALDLQQRGQPRKMRMRRRAQRVGMRKTPCADGLGTSIAKVFQVRQGVGRRTELCQQEQRGKQ